LDQTETKLDDNNNLYLTLTKFNYGKRVREQMKERKEENKVVENKRRNLENLTTPENGNIVYSDDHRTRLERLIPEFYVNQNTVSDDSVEEAKKDEAESDKSSDLSELKEEDKANLFDRLKTKTNFFINKGKKNHLNNFNIDNNYNYNTQLPFLPTSKNIIDENKTRSISQNYNKFISEKKAEEYGIKNAAASNFFRSTKKKENLVENDPHILNIKKLREKFEIIKEKEKEKGKEVKEQNKILGVDLFKYDKKKWQKKNLKEVIK
jgi:hypothetical protein